MLSRASHEFFAAQAIAQAKVNPDPSALEVLRNSPDFYEYGEKLLHLDETAHDPGATTQQRDAAAATLLYAPLMDSQGIPQILAAAAYSHYIADEIGGRFQHRITDARNPFGRDVQNALHIDYSRAIGTTRYENHVPGNAPPEWFRGQVYEDLMAIADIVDHGGQEAPLNLRDRFGIEHFGRYPTDQLVYQEKRDPLTDLEHEVGIYVAKGDDTGALWSTEVYQEIIDTVQVKKELQPTLYEVDSAHELLYHLADAHQPAYGFVESHGNPGSGSLTMSGLDIPTGSHDPRSTRFVLEKVRALPAKERRELRKAWKNSGGIIIDACYSAEPYPEKGRPPAAFAMAEAIGRPVVGMYGECDGVDLTTVDRSDKIVLEIRDPLDAPDCTAALFKPSRLTRGSKDADFVIELVTRRS